MNITLLGIVFGALLAAFPIFIIIRFRLNLMRNFLKSLVRMIVAVGLLAALMELAAWADNIALSIVLSLIICIFTALITTAKARLKLQRHYLPVAAGSLAGILIVGFYFIFLVLGTHNPFVINVYIPVMGLLAGGITSADTKAFVAYSDGLVHHGQLYNYLLGNGCTKKQALDYFVRRSLRASILSVSKQMSRIVFTQSPVAFFVALMGNVSILTAAALQVMLILATASASVVSVFITLTIERKRKK
jgi:putative ABC transport system permease protein